MDALEALSSLNTGIHGEPPRRQRQKSGLSFTFLKKLGLQLGVQAHKCTRLLAVISGKEDAALRGVLAGQLQQLGRLLEDNPRPDEGPLFRRLGHATGRQDEADQYFQYSASSEVRLNQAGQDRAFIISKAAGRYFFQTAGLFPRINHCLQQLDSSNRASLTAVSARIRQLIMSCPLPEALQDGLAHELHALFSLPKQTTLALFPRVHSEDGQRSSFAGLIPPLRQIDRQEPEAMAQAYKKILASLYSPQSLAYMEARGLRHEGTGLSALCVPECAVFAVVRSNNNTLFTAAARMKTKLQRRHGNDLPAPLLQGSSGSTGIAAGKVQIIRNLDDIDTLPEDRVAVLAKARVDWVLLLPRIAALIVEEEMDAGGHTHSLITLAREFGLPLVCGLAQADSILQEGMQVTVDAGQGLVYAGLIDNLVRNAPPRPRSTANSPVAQALTALCELSGACHDPKHTLPSLSQSPASGCTTLPTLLDLILACRLRAIQTLLRHSSRGGILQLAPSLTFSCYDMDGLLPGQGNSGQMLAVESLHAPLLRLLWQGMSEELELHPDRIATLDCSRLKNSVLLGRKCCTVQFAAQDFLIHLTAEQDRHEQHSRFMLLLEDGRAGGRPKRLQLIANRLTAHGLQVQASDTSLRMVNTRTDSQRVEQNLHLLGALIIQALA